MLFVFVNASIQSKAMKNNKIFPESKSYGVVAYHVNL